MIRLYLRIALRNVWKNKLFAVCNLFGLSIGIASFLLIVHYSFHELSYDKFWNDSERIHRVNFINGNQEEFCITPSALASHLKTDIPEVESAARIYTPYNPENTVRIRVGDTDFYEYDVAFVDSTFFDVFPISVPAKSLAAKHDVLISEEYAVKYFGDGDPLKKILSINGSDYQVQGVFKDIPSNSHLPFKVLLPMHVNEQELYVWQWWNVHTYVKTWGNADVKLAETKTKDLLKKHAGDDYADFWDSFRFRYQPVSTIHFTQDVKFDDHTAVSKPYVFIFLAVGLVVLLLACFNFVNLTVSRLTERVLEVSLNKALGAGSGRIVSQQVIEVTLFALISAIISLGLFSLISPAYSQLSQVRVDFNREFFVNAGLFLLLLTCLIGVACAIYPALLLNKLNIASVLKNDSSIKMKGSFARKVIMGFQFFVTIILIVGTVVASRQVELLKKQSPGFDKNQVLLVNLRMFSDEQKETFKGRLEGVTSIGGVALASSPIGSSWGMWGFRTEEMLASESRGVMHYIVADEDFLEVMKIDLLEGRTFIPESDSNRAFIINEAARKHLDLKTPIGAKIGTAEIDGRIIGVVDDFHFASMVNHVNPLVIAHKSLRPGDNRRMPYRFAFVKLKSGSIEQGRADVLKVFEEIMPDQSAEISFQDERFDKLHREQERMGELIFYFGFVALGLGLFGLFAITSQNCRQRAREISVRKIFGATTRQVMMLVSLQSLRPVVIGSVIALPLCYILLDVWLSTMAVRIELDILTLVISAVALGFVAWAVVAIEAIKTAQENPSKVLRN